MKNLLIENAKIIEKSKTRVLLEYEKDGKNQQRVYKYNGKKGVGENVNLFEISNNKLLHILFLLIPVFCLILGLGIGFVFQNKLFQYILALSLAIVSFLIVALLEKFIYKNKLNKIICE